MHLRRMLSEKVANSVLARPFFAKATKGILRFKLLFQWLAIRSFRHGSEECKTGEVRGLIARGPFEVAMLWDQGH